MAAREVPPAATAAGVAPPVAEGSGVAGVPAVAAVGARGEVAAASLCLAISSHPSRELSWSSVKAFGCFEMKSRALAYCSSRDCSGRSAV